MAKDHDLFFLCSLIELISRTQKRKCSEVVQELGAECLRRVYRYADVLHCEPIAKIADELIEEAQILPGEYDNISRCRFLIPTYWDIGEVYARLIQDVCGEKDKIQTLMEVYASWLSDDIQNFNSDLYFQPRDYLRECWREQRIL